MSEKVKDQIRDHSFDGIQEYDNQLPKWWLGTFLLTIIFAFVYWISYHTYEWQPDQKTELEIALKQHRESFKQKAESVSNEEILAIMKNKELIAGASQDYLANCMACHGAGGGGVIGPNLTDKYWLHGGKPVDIYQTILKGVPDKGMVPWQGILSPGQIKNLVAYIMTLEGTNPPGAKAPQGELVE